jgi:hypothetical protein
MDNKQEIAKAIKLIITEYDLAPFTTEKIEMWMNALSNFGAGQVAKSAQTYIITNRFKPQLADIVNGCLAQADDVWMSADEAWASVPKSEHESGLLTDEIAEALSVAAPLLNSGDAIAARMAFKDAYARVVAKAKLNGLKPRYFPSFGSDFHGRVTMLSSAVQKKRIGIDYAMEALPEAKIDILKMSGATNHPLLAAPNPETAKKLKTLLLELRI